MLRIAVAAAFFAVFVSQADAAPNAQYKEVVKALDGIPSAVGVSVHKRLDKCGITVVKDTSWIETRAVDWPEYGAKAGESVLLIMMKMPVAKDQPPTNGVANSRAVWVISHGKPMPLNAWATAIQNRTVPLGYTAWLNC